MPLPDDFLPCSIKQGTVDGESCTLKGFSVPIFEGLSQASEIGDRAIIACSLMGIRVENGKQTVVVFFQLALHVHQGRILIRCVHWALPICLGTFSGKGRRRNGNVDVHQPRTKCAVRLCVGRIVAEAVRYDFSARSDIVRETFQQFLLEPWKSGIDSVEVVFRLWMEGYLNHLTYLLFHPAFLT